MRYGGAGDGEFGAVVTDQSADPTALAVPPAPGALAQRPRAVDPGLFPDDASAEMMDAYRRGFEAYVNPQTGVAVAWGDTWMHDRMGGVGTGRTESRPRRMLSDGTTEILPAKGAAGYALVPTSSDKRALLEFYDECNGIRWGFQRNWGVGEPCAQAWLGVRCAGGRVVELALNLNNVACRGRLNVSALAKLDQLLYLDLSDNFMGGSLPPELGAMPQLQSLALGGNRLEGKLPPELGSLRALRHLDLSGNALRGPLLPALGGLQKLEVLYLGEAGIETRNGLSGPIPEEWAALSSLRRLNLAGDKIGGELPPWLPALTALEELSLASAGLQGTLPPGIGSLRRLAVLSLGRNRLSGTLPPELGSLAALRVLDLSANSLEGPLPPQLGSLPAMEVMDLSANELSGPLPAELGSLTALRVLDLSSNSLSGPLPGSLAALPQLAVLRASGNGGIGGELLASLLSAPRLTELRLEACGLEGPLPQLPLRSEALPPPRLRELLLGGNALSGPIPHGLAAFSALAVLSLRDNSLSGPIPDGLANLTGLQKLDLGGNSLSGPIPDGLGRLPELAELSLSYNELSGAVPHALGAAPLLHSLGLDHNSLSGPVPAWLAQGDSLRVADLSANRLSGRLPDSLWDHARGTVPPLPPRLDRLQPLPRQINLGLNPLFCPLPAWAKALFATCRPVELQSLSPAAGPAAGGTDVVLRTSGLGSMPGLGCVFGGRGGTTWAPALSATDDQLVCAVPPRRQGAAATLVVRVGFEGEPITQFGEIYTYDDSGAEVVL